MSKPESMKTQRGIALIQVIITTSVIMLLTIFFLSLAKSQVSRAQALQDKSLAYLANYSAKNRVLFGLMTSDINELRNQGWNFHGQSFVVNDNATVRLQDLNGLFSLMTMTDDSFLRKLLRQRLDDQEAQTITASMMDWFDKNDIARSHGAEQKDYPPGISVRNARIQTFTELLYINGMTVEAEQLLIDNTTFQPTAFYNPMTSPELLLNAYTNNSGIAAQISALKRTADYSRDTVEDISGIESDEGVDFLIGPGYRLSIDAQVGDSYVGRLEEYQVHPYQEFVLESLSSRPKQRPTLISNK